ncbi:MAG: lipopolysaccharide biosynthesis protein [Ignavibacteriales bacterium]
MSLFKSTAWYTVGNLLARSLVFILLPFYSNLISTDDFGRYSLIMSAYAVFVAIYQGGLFSSFSKYYFDSNDEEYKKRTFSSVLNLIFTVSLAFSIAGTIYRVKVSEILLHSGEYAGLILLLIWTLFIDANFMTVIHLLKTKEQSKSVIYYTSISAVTNLILNIFFVFYLKKGIEGILLAQFFTSVIDGVIMSPIIKANYRFGIDRALVKKILKFSYPLLIAGILSTFVDVADRFILDRFLDKSAVGVYSFSYRIALIMNIFIVAFRSAWTPYSLRIINEQKSYNVLFGRSFTKLVSISLLIFLSVALLTDDLFRIQFGTYHFFNPQYSSGTVIIPFVLIGYAFSGIVSFYSVYPYQSGKSYHFLVSDLIAFIFNILLNILLIPKFGITGAAVATMLSFIFSSMYLYLISRSVKVVYQVKELFILLAGTLIIFAVGQSLRILWLDIVLLTVFTIVIQRTLNLKPRGAK